MKARMRLVYEQMKFYYSVNWIKTLYFNFKKFPFQTAKKLPVFFYGPVKFNSLSGQILINAPIRRAMIGFGQSYEMNTLHKGIAEINLSGTLSFNGHVQFGKDYFVYIKEGAICEFGHMASLASNGKVICVEKISLGDYARLGSECQIIDTNFHPMIDTENGEVFKMTAPIQIGSYNFISNRVSIMKGAVTPDYCSIASNSLCTRDYSFLGKNILIGGIPAKLLKSNISRDWKEEKEDMDKWLII